MWRCSIILCVAIGLCISSCKLSSSDGAKNKKNAYEIAERHIRVNLPEGTAFVDVKNYLQNNGFEFDEDQTVNDIVAVKRNISTRGWVSTCMVVRIRFDSDNKLKIIAIHPEYIGP